MATESDASRTSRVAKEYLENWPYAFQYLRQTMDPDLIESHGSNILSRALNIGGVTAFVGSGISTAYGRISWEDMVNILCDRVLKIAQKCKSKPQCEIVTGLESRLNQLILQKDRRNAEEYLIIFQLCEQLRDEILRINRIAKLNNLEHFADEDERSIRQMVIESMSSDFGHAERLLEQSDNDKFSIILKKFAISNHWSAQDGTLLFFTLITMMMRNAHSKISEQSDVFKYIWDHLIEVTAGNDTKARAIRLPQRRYLCVAALSYLRIHNEAIYNEFINELKNIHDNIAKSGRITNIIDRINDLCLSHLNNEEATSAIKDAANGTQREQIFHLHRDPIRLLNERLGINRFLTTNYDQEISRYLKNRSIRPRPSAVSPQGQDDGPRFSEIVFDGSRTGAAIAFLAGAGERHPGTLHLHGSVSPAGWDDDPGKGLLVTESDYQRRYFRVGPDRDLVNNAIQFAFGASPLLFVGLGMSEGDLLRPLREFMSTPGNFGKRTAVALMPGTRDLAKRTTEKLSLLGRYGVYAIHYGRATVKDSSGQNTDVDWLHEADTIKSDIVAYLKIGNDSNKEEELRTRIRSQNKTNSLFKCTMVKIEGLPTSPDSERNVDIDAAVIRSVAELIANNSLDHNYKKTLAVAVEGAWSTILSTFASAKLLKIRRDWDSWSKSWLRIPEARSPDRLPTNPKAPDNTPLAKGFSLLLYQAVQVPRLPHRHPRKTRFYTDAPSRGFLDLQSALVSSQLNKLSGRRILMLVGDRGIGKGNLFGNLMNKDGEGRLPELLKPLKNNRACQWHGVALLNLSFTQQVMPAFDRLAEFLYQNLKRILTTVNDQAFLERLESRRSSLRTNQLARLRAVMEDWAELGKKYKTHRVFICLEAISIFFDKAGHPKNNQLGQIFDALFSKEFATAPIDLMIMCQLSRLPMQFRAPLDPSVISSTAPDDVDRIHLLHLDSPRRTPRDHISDKERQAGLLIAEPGTSTAGGGIHFLHHTRATTFALSHYPRTAFLIALDSIVSTAGAEYRYGRWIDLLNDITKCDAANNFTRKNAHDLRVIVRYSASLYTVSNNTILANYSIVAMTVLYAILSTIGLRGADRLVLLFSEAFCLDNLNLTPQGYPERISAAAVNFINLCVQAVTAGCPHGHENMECKGACQDNECTEINKCILASHDENKINEIKDHSADGKIAKFDEQIRNRIFMSAFKKFNNFTTNDNKQETQDFMAFCKVYDERMKRLFRDIGSNRFALTLLMAGCFESTTDLSWLELSNRESQRTIRDAVWEKKEAVSRFVERVANSAATLAPNRKADAVIAAVFDHYERHHRDGRYLSFSEGLEMVLPRQETRATTTIPLATRGQYRLMKVVLWTLAIMGRPVELELLCLCSEIRSAAQELLRENRHDSSEPNILVIVKETLGLCVARCLVFSLNELEDRDGSSARADNDNDFTHRSRFVIHRLMQRHILHEMGASPLEAGEWGPFMLSLYASQSDETPQITHAAHERILKVIKELSCYPGFRTDFGTLDDILNCHMEAHGLPEERRLTLKVQALRAAYGIIRSIYCVGILTHLKKTDTGNINDDPAPFEEFRRLVRWMLRMAIHLENALKKDPPGHNPDLHLPFYAEEIVWLYNECGVLSLVCGNLSDALALFQMAIKATERHMEPSERGPLHVRIRLNQAMVYIERGRGGHIRSYLEDIVKLDHESRVPHLLASGYLALLDHLSGNFAKARKEYEYVITQLNDLGRSRAAAIFCRHMGDLCRADPREDINEADHWFDLASHLSRKGNHLDINYHVEISRARHDIEQAKNSSDIHGRLDAIENYAHQLGLSRLLCKVAELRSNLLLKQGENRLALSEATRSLELAIRNDLKIQKVKALAILGEIYVARKQADQALPLLDLGIRLAEQAGVNSTLRRLILTREKLDTSTEKSRI